MKKNAYVKSTNRAARLAALLLAALFALSACSGASKSAGAGYAMSEPSAPEAMYEYSMDADDAMMDTAEAPMEEPMPMPAATADGGTSALSASTTGASAEPDTNQSKLIRTVYISGETKTFDSAVEWINNDVEAYGGYMESTSITGKKPEEWSDEGRYADFTVRVPAERLEDFLMSTHGAIDVISESSSVENVSAHYYDLEARKESYEIQLERLTSILTDAAVLADVIALETEIARVRYEIESIETTLRGYDNRVGYSTVHISFYELTEFDRPQAQPATFGEEISAGFSDGWNGSVRGLKDFAVWFVSSLPVLLILAAIVTIAVIVIRKRLTKKRAVKSPLEEIRNIPAVDDVTSDADDTKNETEE